MYIQFVHECCGLRKKTDYFTVMHAVDLGTMSRGMLTHVHVHEAHDIVYRVTLCGAT